MAAAGEPALTHRPGLTDQQRRAITARGVSVALSAGAGCGKTFVLTERFLSQLDPSAGADQGRPRLGQLVAITFTERAAREMRDRIRAACHRRLIDAPEDQVDYWLELIRELDTARISTIHSFCGSLLRSHAVEACLDPQFRMLDAAQSETLLFELLDHQLRGRLAERDEAVIQLVVQFGLGRLYQMIAAMLGRRQQLDPQQWRDETADRLVARWEEFWRSDTLPRVLDRIATSPAAATLLEIARQCPCSHPVMQARFEALCRLIPALAAGDAAGLAEIAENARVQGGGTKKAWQSEELYGQFRDAAADLRKLIERQTRSIEFDPVAARPAAETALRLFGLTLGVAEAYDAIKQEMGVLDFDDLLIRARQLLVGPERESVRKRPAAQIRLLLVDEFQDTDPLQVELVEAICAHDVTGGKLFFVGDFKQSIYRFRGADPQVFRRLSDSIPAHGRMPLSLNFRSQPAILDFVNALFRDELGPDYEPLRPHRPQVGPTPAVELLLTADDPDATGNDDSGDYGSDYGNGEGRDREASDDDSPTKRRRRREADWIARRIRDLLDSGEKIVWDAEAAKAGRPAARAVRPGDVALLFRALSNVEYYEEALRRYGIDYYLVGGHAFYAQQEIFDLVNLLRAVESPCDEVSLAGALRSPMFGLWDETLFWLARHGQGLQAGLMAEHLPGEITGDQRRRAEFAAATLGQLRAMKDRVPIARLIREVLDRTGYDAVLLAEFLGERKLANLLKLVEQARNFDRAGIFTLADFITQLSQFVARQPDEALAATHPESADVVRLMTIHQSKGLEFPVVVVTDVDRRRRNPTATVAFTPQLGPMVKDPNAVSGFDLYMAAESDEERAETLRLLYVATTRAADYLILSAGLKDLDSAAGPWMELIRRRCTGLASGSRGGQRDVELDRGTDADSQGSGDGEAYCGTVYCGDVPLRLTTTAPVLRSKIASGAVRRDLRKIVAKAQQMAESGSGRVPKHLDPIAPDLTARRQFSFSRLSGMLHAVAGGELERVDEGVGGGLSQFSFDENGTVPLAGTVLDRTQDETRFEGDSPMTPRADTEGDSPIFAPQKLGQSPGQESAAALDPRGLGTLVHAVLAEVDFAQPGDVRERVTRHAARHLPQVDGAGGELDEPIAMLGRFLASPRAARIAAADEVHAELEFLLAWPPGDPQPGGPYLQGFLDCLYRDADGWHVIDYKTNRASEATLAAVAANYELQMSVYALAVEQILGVAPCELTLCFLRPGLEHTFAWTDPARRRTVELVSRLLTPT